MLLLKRLRLSKQLLENLYKKCPAPNRVGHLWLLFVAKTNKCRIENEYNDY